MPAKKPNKVDRRNDFILRDAGMRATAHVKSYIATHPLYLGSLGEAEFTKAMEAITKAMVHMYGAGMSDTLDVVDGRDLQKVE